MALQSRKQSTRAVLAIAAAVAILFSLRTIYQEIRHQDAAERARAIEESVPRPADWQQQVERARKTVEGQLNAFKDGDWEKAFTYAAGSFHEQMQVSDFRQMVEGGFPQIARPREVRLGTGDWLGGEVGVEVTVTGQDGVTAHYVYLVAEEEEGWKVTGVREGQPPDPDGTARPEPTEPGTPAPPRDPQGAA
jgi:hypothetical protein